MHAPRPSHTSLRRSWPVSLLILGAAVMPAALSAQAEPNQGWAVVPWLGFGVVRDNGGWQSGGMEAAVDLEYGGTRWRWSGYASQRGLGVGCSHSCFEGGPALALGGSRSIGPLWIGGGAAVMKRHGAWSLFPYGRVSLDTGRVRWAMRLELPQEDVGIYVPIMIGIPIGR